MLTSVKYSRFFQTLLIIILLCGCDKNNPQPTKTIIKNEKQEKKNQDLDKIKHISKYKFEDFPINKTEQKNQKLKLNTNLNSFTRHYRTMIREAFENLDVNFAGKYIIDYWGCGSPCGVGITINAVNAKLIELPSSSVGYRFQKDSRLLIVNPPDSLGYIMKDCFYCEPEFYHLDTLKSKFIKLK